ncbi:type II secretion system F family protein [Guptibacillus hwajinpoensis]|uniref:type II secretion system F family protein n=1 Tax=Guptibacillus hwajinpoensis TaxID=208199 RepID=UPI001CFDD0A7|nr:type II secretion system F family protein [Pseudalkalibacillus hwajinpoensis]WLR59262.1 type II secretion system F family protein [Pseudalkalibacillus hwajinpoensis]
MNDWVLLLVIFVSVTSLFYLISKGVMRKKKTNERIKRFIPQAIAATEVKEKQKNETFRKWIRSFAKAFSGLQFSHKTKKSLEQSGSSLKAEEFFVIRILSAMAVAGLLYVLGVPWFVSILSLLIGFIIPGIYIAIKARKRIKLLSYQLVEALGTMSNSMRAGFSFVQTMQLIGKEMPDPIGPEFDRAVREIGMGIPMETVFQSLLERLPNKELEVVIQAILAQRKSGGNLAQLMDTMEDTIRGRIRILEELKTLTAQGKLSSWIITALPLVMGIYLYFVSPEYLEPMLTYPLGCFLLVTGAISLLIGWFLIQKIVRIEV